MNKNVRHFPPVPSALVARLAKPDGGFTWQPAFAYEPTQGFAVAIYPNRNLTFGNWKSALNRIGNYIEWNRHLLSCTDNFLGAWRDPATDKIHLDVSVVVESREEAEQLAREHGQLAYYDFAAGRSQALYSTPAERIRVRA